MVFMVGFLSAFAVLIVMCRLGMKRFAGYPALCDAGVTIGLAALLYGTWSGMVAAIVGGLTFSVILTAYRHIFGYSRFTIKGWKETEGKANGQFKDIISTARARAAVREQSNFV